MPIPGDDHPMTDQDLDQPATRRDLRALETALRDDMRALEATLDVKFDERTAELRRHFDLTAENFRAEFRNLFDWTNATTSSFGTRVTPFERRRKTH
jgi:hypothetical protein